MFIPGDVLRMIDKKVVNYTRRTRRRCGSSSTTSASARAGAVGDARHRGDDRAPQDAAVEAHRHRPHLQRQARAPRASSAATSTSSKMENVKMQKEYLDDSHPRRVLGPRREVSRTPLSESDVDRYASPQIIHGGDKIDVQPPRDGEQYGDEAIESAFTRCSRCRRRRTRTRRAGT